MTPSEHLPQLDTQNIPSRSRALLLFRALPDHAGKAFQRHQRLAGIGPFLQFLDRDVIERLAAGAAREQRARDVDHVRRARRAHRTIGVPQLAQKLRTAFVLVLVSRDRCLALGDAKALAPASDIGGIGRAMRAAARRRMIMPGPARRHVDLEADLAAQALADAGLPGATGFDLLLFCFFELGKHVPSSRFVIACDKRRAFAQGSEATSNPYLLCSVMDCFAALAMTVAMAQACANSSCAG